MSDLNQLSMALGMSTLETNIGLARINFDFSLYKVQAPVEYQELGEVLSAKRREAAEGGTSHITVRKLNALFEQVLPPIPNITKAYGLRSSEVARSTEDKETRRNMMHRLFPEHSGLAGTNIWAAATSGGKAIAVHLLACMLARLWPSSESTSIWVELVAERKKQLRDARNDLSLPALTAMEVSISRECLAEWDASARAWLRAADKALEKQQKQLMLIIGNVDVAVNSKIDVYESVLQAWMSTVENMVSGMPQMVRSGAVLLALSAWHLYPNMFVLGETPKTIDMHDGLLDPAGVLTIGIQNASEGEGDGVYWSLPLAYHRYYGPSVTSTRATGSHSSRISFNQLVQVVLGCVFRDCGFADTEPLDSAMFFKVLHECLGSGTSTKGASSSDAESHTPIAWTKVIASGATHLLEAEHAELESLKRLIANGKRRSNLLGHIKCPMEPVFGICRPDLFLSLQNSPESAVSAIRELICRQNYRDERYIIRYKEAEGVFSYASACHPHRWRYSSVYHEQTPEERTKEISSTAIKTSDRYLVWNDPPHGFPRERDSRLIQKARGSTDQFQAIPESTDGPSKRKKKRKKAGALDRPCLVLQFLFGESDSVALYGPLSHTDRLIFELEDVLNALRLHRMEPTKLENYLRSQECFTSEYIDVQDSLTAIAAASEIYKSLPDATVSIDIASHSLCELHWLPRTTQGRVMQGLAPNLVETFACIASFETGSAQIPLSGMDEVLALSAGNSIYVSQHLLCDPTEDYQPNEVQRIEGNIGKPGLSLLIPPKNPMIKSLTGETWNLINHSDFDGKFEDNFETTSLHLSFTEYEFPIILGTHGVYQREASFVESIVSIYDKGSWIADLDILAALKNEKLTRLAVGRHIADSTCRTDSSVDHRVLDNAMIPEVGSRKLKLKFQATSIDSWNELLDPPQNICVLRAHGNWIGRLSATVLSTQLDFNTFVVPLECEDICWECVETLVGRHQGKSIIIL